MNEICLSETSETAHPLTRRHFPEGRSPQIVFKPNSHFLISINRRNLHYGHHLTTNGEMGRARSTYNEDEEYVHSYNPETRKKKTTSET